jgi:hypothetical protein
MQVCKIYGINWNAYKMLDGNPRRTESRADTDPT